MRLTEQRRSELQARGGEIYRKVLVEGRKMTDQETSELRTIEGQLDADEYERQHGEPPAAQPSDAQRRFTAGVETRTRELRPGEVRILGTKDRLSDCFAHGNEDLSIGRLVVARALGDFSRLSEPELRVMDETTGSLGAFTVPTPLSARLIDLARNQTRVIQAGAVTIPMDSATLKMARLAGDPTAAWKTENAADAGASDLTFEQVLFTARTLVARGKMSVELFEDGANIDGVVSDALAAALALELDRVSLLGSGTPPEPRGVLNAVGIHTVPTAGALTNYAELITAYRYILESNETPSGIIYSPLVWAELEALTETTTGQPLRAPASIQALAKFITKQVGTYTSPVTDQNAFMADWAKLMIGIRTSITLEVSRVASDASTSAFNALQVFFRAYLRADIQLARPGAFCALTGIL